MRGYIAEVKAEKDSADQNQHEYIYKQPPITHFPFTHGDSLEVARLKIREEMTYDL